jgi:integrase
VSLGFDPVTGRRRRKYLTGDTRAEVRDRLVDIQKDITEGRPITFDGNLTVAALVATWFEAIKPTVRPRTAVNYAAHARRIRASSIGTLRAVVLKAAHVQGFIDDLAAEGLRPFTIRNVRAVLRMALGWGVDFELIPRNVATGRRIRLPKGETFHGRRLTQDEMRRLLTVAEGERLGALWVVLVGLGLRLGEGLGLRWSELDFAARQLRVTGSVHRLTGRGVIIAPPKTEASRRTLPLPGIVADALRRHRARQATERLAAGAEWAPSVEAPDLVFTSRTGGPLDPRNVCKRDWSRLLAKVGIEGRCRIHDLRGTCATALLAAGEPLPTIQALLGHTDLRTTRMAYADVLPAALDQAARTMDRVLGG